VLIDFSSSSEIVYFCSPECRHKFREKRAVGQILDLMLERLYRRPKEDILSETLRQEIEELLKENEENDQGTS
jgi:hypothetical protein